MSRDAQGMLRMSALELAEDVRKQTRTDTPTSQDTDASELETVDSIEDQIETMARDLEALLARKMPGVNPETGGRS